MGWLDGLFNGNSSDAQGSGTGGGSGWLGPVVGAAPSPPAQGPGLLDRLTAGATNLTTGGNPLAGILNAVNGLATGQRTDALGAMLAQQGAVRQALTAAGVPDAVAAAAAMNPEVLKTVAPQLYSKPQPQKLKDAYGAERIVFANPDRQTVTDPAAGTSAASARGMSLLAPGVKYDQGLPAEPYLAQFTPEVQDAIKAHVAAGMDGDPRRIAIANAARPFAQHYARKARNVASPVAPPPKGRTEGEE
jgi:hypothetical protein